MAFAEKTEVPFERSIADIVTLLDRAGAEDIGQMQSRARFLLEFHHSGRIIRFIVPFASAEEVERVRGRRHFADAEAQLRRQRGRALLLVIKAKLESIETGIETVEQAFLANVVMPSSGTTVHEQIAPLIEQHYAGKKADTPLLLGPPR